MAFFLNSELLQITGSGGSRSFAQKNGSKFWMSDSGTGLPLEGDFA